jgi:hypothetical protein
MGRGMSGIVQFPAPATDALHRLDAGERLFIWGFRAIARYRRFGEPTVAELQQVYCRFGVGDAVCSLDALVEAFARTAHAPLELHSPGCPCVSDSETRLLRAAAAAQSGALAIARRELERWIPELAADWALAPLCGLSSLFEAAGLNLPLRDGQPASRETIAARTWPSPPHTLH